MYRIRDKPSSAKSSRSPGTHKPFDDNAWNDNVVYQNIPSYNSKADKHCLGFFNIRKLHKKQIRQTHSTRPYNPLNKEPRHATAPKNEITPEQIEILKEELNLT